ncbi:MAG: MarR family transcriptional regulator [Hyphomicrobiales bacterium]|nr:MarR family transcriptional regulator [Hyphomicrobiales bacterium]
MARAAVSGRKTDLKRRTRADTHGGPVAADARSSRAALDLENYVPAFLTWIANKLSSSASAVYRREFGIGIVEWRIMALLAVEPWITSGRICEVIGLDKAGVSRSVRFMQDKKLVETRFRDNNQRRQFIALTAEGIELHDRVVTVARRREEQLLTGLTAEERAAAVALLARMHDNLPLVKGGG